MSKTDVKSLFMIFPKIRIFHGVLLLLFCRIIINAATAPVLKTGDSFYSFFWAQTIGDTTASGYYGYVSVTGQIQDSASTTCSAKFKLDRCSWWQSMVVQAFTDIGVLFTNSKPDSIVSCSGKFAIVPWVQSINGKTDSSSYLMHFYFPVLPSGQSYNRFDYFSVKYNDTISVQFQANSDSVFAGSFISRQPGKPTAIVAKNAITVLTTSKNKLRLKSLQIRGQYAPMVSSYLGFDLSKLKKDAVSYGISILDTILPEQIIQVKSVTLSGSPSISADSTYRLSWSFAAANIVDRCSLYVALDSGVTWIPAGMTLGSDSSFRWVAPHKKSPHNFIKVRVTGKDGQKAEAVSPEFAITIIAPIDTIVPPVNNYLLRAGPLDSATVRLSWSPQGARDPKVYRIGIRFDTIHFPTSMNDSLTKSLGMFGMSDTTDTVRNLQQGRLYYFSLFVADSAGNWSVATAASMAKIRLGTTTGQPVVIGIDTQRVLNNSVLIWTANTLQTPYFDTLDAWDGQINNNGFVQTSQGFAFRQGRLPAKVTVCLKITYLTIAPTLKPLNQRLYRYNIYTGKWRINDDPVVIDTINHTLTTTCNDLSLPFMVMIDTLAPVTTGRLNRQTTFSINDRIVDTFMVKDNIENVSLQLLAAPGNLAYSDISLYVTPGKNPDEYLTSIPPYIADQISGLRSILVIGDGINTDTINLSHSIWRDGANCDDTIAHGMEWTPLFVTAQPQTPNLSSALSFSASPTSPLTYSKKDERIIQWLPRQDNGNGADKWVEYEPSKDSLFKLIPGKLFWMKTRTDCVIHYGKAIVPPQNNVFSIPLNKNAWTDFSIPFKYPLYIGDIIDATSKVKGQRFDSLTIYKWVKTATSYRTEPAYLNGILGANDSMIAGGAAYSVQNAMIDSFTLQIPPLCTAISFYNHPKAANKTVSSKMAWNTRIGLITANAERLAPIYCASLPPNHIPRYYPLPPSFSSIKSGVFDRPNNRIYGHAATGDISGGGTNYEIVCENNASSSSPVSLFIEKETGLPPGIKTFLFSAVSNKPGIIGDTLKMSLNPMQKNTVFVAVGTEDYAKKMFAYLTSKLFLQVISQAGRIKINYSLPYNATSVQFTMYNLIGRRIAEIQPNGRIITGKASFVWQGQFAHGFYIIEMRVMLAETKTPCFLRQKVVYVR